MKKGLIAGLGAIVVILAVVFWLAASAGPENAPSEMKTIEVNVNAPR